MTRQARAMEALDVSGGGWWWQRRRRRAHVIRVRTAWVRAGLVVRYGPVGVVCHGLRPRITYGRGVFGAAGLAGGALAFQGQGSSACDGQVALEQVQRLSLVTIALPASRRARALAVHYGSPDGWRVGVFSGGGVPELAGALSDAGALPLHDAGEGRDDFGPARATRMIQDIYGEWTPEREGALYLAPDRLLFEWREAIPLATMARLDVYHGGEGRRAGTLLRVEYAAPDGALQAAGFLVEHAGRWAEAIVRRADLPLAVHEGRKQKGA
ncbi:MAG: hypothetical protein M5U29_09565 [Anaerolineae bacterium]|nr:hypothetical protein [Anaerolineae bacterium]